jgi:hypothetical protein
MDELQYRIMRNPETLASYRRWARESWAQALPLTLAAVACLVVGGLLLGRDIVHPSRMAMSVAAGLLSVGGGLMMASVAFVMWRRRRRPWIDPAGS